jgi:hypothetical protein
MKQWGPMMAGPLIAAPGSIWAEAWIAASPSRRSFLLRQGFGGRGGAEGEVGPAGDIGGEAHGGRVVRLDFARQLPPPPLRGPPRPAEAGEEKDGAGRPAQSVDGSCLI